MVPRISLIIFISAALLSSVTAMAQSFDTDGDGYDDNHDNCTLRANPSQLDTDGDFMGNICDGDFDNSGLINAADLAYMRAVFFTDDPDADLNGDRIVNFADLNVMREMYFEAPGPTATNPAQPPCNCYFSGDCNDGDPGTNLFCDYGPGSFTTEDLCVWRDTKPNGQYLQGCNIESDLTTGAWTPNICDGLCKPAGGGSSIGLEDHNLVAQAIGFWAEAMINPSVAGGGPVDPEMAEQASAVQFNGIGVPLMLGRQTADALAMASGEPFHNYFCHWEGHPADDNPPVVDLSGDNCRINSGRLTAEALVAEIRTPGSAAEIMKGIAAYCPDWQTMFGTQCDPGPGALACAIQFVQAQAHFLRTPPAAPSAAPDPRDLLLGKALR